MKKKFTFIVLAVCLLISVWIFVGINLDTSYATNVHQFQPMNFENAVSLPDGLNVRCGPSLRYPVVTILTKNENVNVLGKLGNWYAIYEPLNEYSGFVYGKYLSLSGVTPTTTPTTTPVATPISTPVVATPTPMPIGSPTTTVPTTVTVTAEEQTLLNLVNEARQKAGASNLSFDSELMKCAKAKAQDMVNNNYFAHESPTYGSPFDMMRQFGISFKSAGENIAGNQSVEGAFNAWMNSQGHKENILNTNFNYVGFGIVNSSTYGKILVQQFIGR